jgi:CxxC-x17-CxxC domain-containing protein
VGYKDKTITCVDCGAEFVFSAEEQALFASKGYGYRPVRQMYPVVCAQCGKDTQVPFEPRQGRPVYCSDCYNAMRTNR